MSDGLDLFQERIRKLIQDNRQRTEQVARGFDPQVTLQKLLGMKELGLGEPKWKKEAYPGELKKWPPLKKKGL